MKGWIYILECADDSYYTGSTKNLEVRLAQHQNGEGANHTKKRLPVKLVYYEEYPRIDLAFRREKQVQGWSRKKKEALINGAPEMLPKLAIAYRDKECGFESLSHRESPLPEALEGRNKKDKRKKDENNHSLASSPAIHKKQPPTIEVPTRKGSKQIALGWIPEDWVLKRLGSISIINGEYGINAPAVDFDENLPAYIRITDINDDGFFSVEKKRSVNDTNSSNFYLKKNDLVFVRTGATVGKAYLYNEKDGDLVFAGFLIRFRIDSVKADPYYIWTYTKTKQYWDWVLTVSRRSGQPGINSKEYSSLQILLPPLPEQHRIAALLSTWDEAIHKTQGLIVQLQQRNKGLMQQLLTGTSRTSAPNGEKFSEEWKGVNANDIFESVSMKNNGDERLLSATQDRGIIPRDMLAARVTMPRGKTNAFKLVESGDFVISLRSFQGGIEYSEYRGLVSPAYTVLKPKKSINNFFYKYYFKSYDFIGHLAVAVIGIRDGKQVSYEDFSILKIPYPTIGEQNAIAMLLENADDELNIYEQKLATLQQQKNGLTQVLLTGEKRFKN